METPTRNRQHPPRRRRRSRKKRRLRLAMFGFLLFSLVIGLSAIGYASWRVNHAVDMVTRSSADLPTENDSDGEQTAGDDPFTVLILGRDHRPESGTNLTDVMIVAAVDPKEKQVSMVSIPRDTKVYLPVIDRRVKANEAFNLGEILHKQAVNEQRPPETDGPSLAKEMAGNLFGLEIDHYILVDFQSFMAMVDAVDGITVDVDRDMIYHDPTDGTHINLKAGRQRLSGKKALDWVRHRHDDRGIEYFSSDFDRNRRQQEAIRAIARELVSIDGLTKIFDVMDAMAEHIQTDLSKNQITKLAWNFKSLDVSAIQTIETPHVYWDSGRLQTVIPDEDLTHAQLELQAVLNNGKNG